MLNVSTECQVICPCNMALLFKLQKSYKTTCIKFLWYLRTILNQNPLFFVLPLYFVHTMFVLQGSLIKSLVMLVRKTKRAKVITL